MLLSGTVADRVRDRLPAGAALRDLGAHRLKDLTRAEHVFQLDGPDLAPSFPALLSLSTHRNNLPLQLTQLVGREADLVELRERLAETRLITLTGAGGVGKTRLGLQLGADVLERFPDGVWFVEFATLATDDALIDRIAEAIEAPIADIGSPRAGILAHLRTQRTLLIFNNCEHLLDGIAEIVETLLQTCPGVYAIATSRERLGIAGELVRSVASLAYPAADVPLTAASALDYGAVALFVERMRATTNAKPYDDDDAPTIGKIVRRLDGIPFAIELAASRTAFLTVREISERLDERFRLLTSDARSALPRNRTMRATFDWSYDLLSEREARVFRRIAVFAGGWTLAAFVDVCSDELDDEWEAVAAVAALASLVQKLLVAHDAFGTTSRYRLLESTREYAREKSPRAARPTTSRCGTSRRTRARSTMPAGSGMRWTISRGSEPSRTTSRTCASPSIGASAGPRWRGRRSSCCSPSGSSGSSSICPRRSAGSTPRSRAPSPSATSSSSPGCAPSEPRSSCMPAPRSTSSSAPRATRT